MSSAFLGTTLPRHFGASCPSQPLTYEDAGPHGTSRQLEPQLPLASPSLWDDQPWRRPPPPGAVGPSAPVPTARTLAEARRALDPAGPAPCPSLASWVSSPTTRTPPPSPQAATSTSAMAPTPARPSTPPCRLQLPFGPHVPPPGPGRHRHLLRGARPGAPPGVVPRRTDGRNCLRTRGRRSWARVVRGEAEGVRLFGGADPHATVGCPGCVVFPYHWIASRRRYPIAHAAERGARPD